MLAVECGQRLADARAAGHIAGRVSGARHRRVVIAPGELARNAGEAGAEHEGLHATLRRHARVHVLEQHPSVRLHRAGHVAHEHHWARLARGLAPAALHRLPAVAQRGVDGAAEVVGLAAAAGAPEAPALPCRPPMCQPHDQPPRQLTLGLRVFGEVLLAQDLHVAPSGGQRPLVDRLLLRGLVARYGHARQCDARGLELGGREVEPVVIECGAEARQERRVERLDVSVT